MIGDSSRTGSRSLRQQVKAERAGGIEPIERDVEADLDFGLVLRGNGHLGSLLVRLAVEFGLDDERPGAFARRVVVDRRNHEHVPVVGLDVVPRADPEGRRCVVVVRRIAAARVGLARRIPRTAGGGGVDAAGEKPGGRRPRQRADQSPSSHVPP